MDDKVEQWKPKEIIIHESVKNDPITHYFLAQCPGILVQYVTTGIPKEIIKVSEILNQAKGGMLDNTITPVS